MSNFLIISNIILWVLLIVIAVVVLSIMRNIGILYQHLEKENQPREKSLLKIGQPLLFAPVHSFDGSTIDLATLKGVATAFAIISPDCYPCREVVKHLLLTSNHADPFDLEVEQTVIINIGDRKTTLSLFQEYDIDINTLNLYYDPKRIIFESWGINMTPTFIIVNNNNLVTGQQSGFAVPSHSVST